MYKKDVEVKSLSKNGFLNSKISNSQTKNRNHNRVRKKYWKLLKIGSGLYIARKIHTKVEKRSNHHKLFVLFLNHEKVTIVDRPFFVSYSYSYSSDFISQREISISIYHEEWDHKNPWWGLSISICHKQHLLQDFDVRSLFLEIFIGQSDFYLNQVWV